MTKTWTQNTKTGTQGIVRARYNRVSDGKVMIEVDTWPRHPPLVRCSL